MAEREGFSGTRNRDQQDELTGETRRSESIFESRLREPTEEEIASGVAYFNSFGVSEDDWEDEDSNNVQELSDPETPIHGDSGTVALKDQAEWAKCEMDIRKWSIMSMVDGDLSRNTIRKIVRGEPVRQKSLDKFVDKLNTHPRHKNASYRDAR